MNKQYMAQRDAELQMRLLYPMPASNRIEQFRRDLDYTEIVAQRLRAAYRRLGEPK